MSVDIERVVVLGPEGTYLDGLARSMDLDVPIVYGSDIPDMVAQAEASPEIAALLPIKNTLDGTLNDVVGVFQARRLMVMAAAKLDVVSNIMGLGTLDEADSIGGKDVALNQIKKFMPDLKRKKMTSTAAAAQQIQETGDKTMLAVGTKALAGLYGLNVLAERVQDTEGTDDLNRTTVLMARGRNGWKFDPDKVDPSSNLSGTMIFRVEDSYILGSLYRALGEIADREIDLTNIESLTIWGTEMSEFFVTFSGLGGAIADLVTSQQAEANIKVDILGMHPDPALYSSADY